MENTAGITAPLNLSSIDLAVDPPRAADWFSIKVIDTKFAPKQLTGATREYKVMQISASQSGLREARIVGDAGQGTQDLGFRATTDVLVEVAPKKETTVEKK